jgi:hypothetical protein
MRMWSNVEGEEKTRGRIVVRGGCWAGLGEASLVKKRR